MTPVSSRSSISEVGAQSQRPVVRSACLNCRSAKRRCDGVGPVCGPCQSRGIENGGCNFVSSKRGGPRYKGVKGAEAAKVKADKDRAKEAAKTIKVKQTQWNGDITRKASYIASDTTSTPSHHSGSPSAHGTDSRSSFSTQWPPIGPMPSQQQSPETSSNYSQSAFNSPFVGTTPGLPINSFNSSFAFQQGYTSQQTLNQRSASNQQSIAPPQLSPHQSQISLESNSRTSPPPLSESFGTNHAADTLSFANVEMWQKLQDGVSEHDLNNFMDFYSRLENLPKAGVAGTSHAGIAGGGLLDPLDVLMDWEGGVIGNNVQDNEQGVRTLLSDYYDLVYPSCPVLLPPGNLPSLAFYFSGKGPCGLFAAISSIVSLHLPAQEAVKTLKNSQAAMARLQGLSGKVSPTSMSPAERLSTKEEIAAYHAKTSELILHQYEETKATCFIDTTCPNPFAGMDEELITIEAAAAHTLLCHYYYGSGKPLSHHRAYKHAVEAWNLVQKLDLRSSTWQEHSVNSIHYTNATRPFSSDLKLEWGKRVYWASYAAATVMSCTGGFQPFGNPKDEIMDLKLRPHLEHDVAAWSIMVRGAQQVSRTYRLLYELDCLRAKVAAQGNNVNQKQLHEAGMERQAIFNAMLKLDSEIGTYTRFDPNWRSLTLGQEGQEGVSHHTEDTEKLLAKSLKIAGRLMTSGALIILHRAQAFSNARVFMQPQCGMPEAVRLHKPLQYDVLLHRAMTEETTNGDSSKDCKELVPSSDFSCPTMGAPLANTNSNAALKHPLLIDRFAGGPFEPTHSLERCRFAASAMINTLPTLIHQQGVPKLPPYSACSFVLCAYATLMLTLLIQIHGQEAVAAANQQKQEMFHNGQQQQLQQSTDSSSDDRSIELQKQLAVHRAPVKDVILVLNRFASIWAKAIEYEDEVKTLLAANEIIT